MSFWKPTKPKKTEPHKQGQLLPHPQCREVGGLNQSGRCWLETVGTTCARSTNPVTGLGAPTADQS